MCITAVNFYVQYQGLHYSLNISYALCYVSILSVCTNK